MSKIVRDWGKFDDNGIFQYALNPLGFVCNPTDEQLTDAGYRRVVKDNKPEDPEGERGFWKESEPVLDGDVIRISWNWIKEEETEPVRGSRKFSKLRLYTVLTRMGLWNSLVTWMEGMVIDGISVKVAFDLAQELAEDNEMFAPYLKLAQNALGVSDDVVEQILSASILEED